MLLLVGADTGFLKRGCFRLYLIQGVGGVVGLPDMKIGGLLPRCENLGGGGGGGGDAVRFGPNMKNGGFCPLQAQYEKCVWVGGGGGGGGKC